MTTINQANITGSIVLGEFNITVAQNEELSLNHEFLSDQLLLAVATSEYPGYRFYPVNILNKSFYDNADSSHTINVVGEYDKSLEYNADRIGKVIYIDNDVMGNRYKCDLLGIEFIESM